MKRVPPSERTKERIARVFSGESAEVDPRSELVRLAVQRVVEEALEATVRDLLGREYYERQAGSQGYRNGYRKGRLKTSEGEVRYAVPQVRDVDATALRELRGQVAGRTEALEELALEMYARGCSTRDIEAIFTDEEGHRLLSRTAVSEVTQALWEEYESFATRDLSEVQPLYLFIDGIASRLSPGVRREAVLCAWAITWEGKKILVHLSPGTKESTDCCRDFIEDMRRRGLGDPVLVTTDGAPGLIRAVEECFPLSRRQRCLAHKMRNLLAKAPDAVRAELQEAARAAYQAPSPAMARALREDLATRFAEQAPAAVRCFEEDFESCIVHLELPPTHRKVTRTTNLLERLFEEERRRSKVVPTLWGERPVLKLSFAALIRASESWRGVRITDLERHQLERLRDQIHDKHRKAHQPAVTSTERSTPNRISSKGGT
jgi:putative transposase